MCYFHTANIATVRHIGKSYKLEFMKNIIGSSCVGAYIMRDHLHQEFINPFIWTAVDKESMINLINHYDNIDWFNIDVRIDDRFNEFSKPRLIIDNLVTLRYPHHMFTTFDTSIRRHKNDIYYCEIWQYIADAYLRRIKRMLTSKLDPIFVWAGAWEDQQPPKNYKSLISTKYKVVTCKNPGINGINHKCANLIMQKMLI